MTGEITLRGRVMPIGGLKEKLIAAQRNRIATVIIPRDNQKDLKEVPESVRAQLRIVLVEHMDEVLREALAVDDPARLFGDRAGQVVTYHDVPPEPEQAPPSLPVDVPAPDRPAL